MECLITYLDQITYGKHIRVQNSAKRSTLYLRKKIDELYYLNLIGDLCDFAVCKEKERFELKFVAIVNRYYIT